MRIASRSISDNGIGVGVFVGTGVGVSVGTGVGVFVGMDVGVSVGTGVGVSVGTDVDEQADKNIRPIKAKVLSNRALILIGYFSPSLPSLSILSVRA